MDDNTTKLLRSIADFVVLAALTVAVPLVVYVDAVLIGHGVPECSATEISQEAMLLFTALLFWAEARRRSQDRGLFILVGGFFACLFVRELDFLFDDIHRGFWMLPFLLTFIVSLGCALPYRNTIRSSMAAFADSRSCVYISIGLLILIAFSRLFGSNQLMWGEIMGEHYRSEYKSIIQEGLELFGCAFILFGAWLLRRDQPTSQS